MRYRKISKSDFVNANGEVKKIYDVRDAEISSIYVTQDKERDREIDDFAVSIWGSNSEVMSYVLREQNIEKMLCVDFNEREMITIDVPARYGV